MISLQILNSPNILFQTRAPALSYPHINKVTPSAITIPSHCTEPWSILRTGFPNQSFVPSEPSSPNVLYNLLKSIFSYTLWWSHNKGETFLCFIYTRVVSFFSPVVMKWCVCLFLNLVSHYLQTHTRHFWILYNYQVVLQLWCFCFSIWICYSSKTWTLIIQYTEKKILDLRLNIYL